MSIIGNSSWTFKFCVIDDAGKLVAHFRTRAEAESFIRSEFEKSAIEALLAAELAR